MVPRSSFGRITGWTKPPGYPILLSLSPILLPQGTGRPVLSNSIINWNFHFLQSFNDREIAELLSLLNLLSSSQPSQHPDCKVWTLYSSSSYICKSFFYHITKNPGCYHSPFTNAFWQVNVPSKVKVFAWPAILN